MPALPVLTGAIGTRVFTKPAVLKGRSRFDPALRDSRFWLWSGPVSNLREETDIMRRRRIVRKAPAGPEVPQLPMRCPPAMLRTAGRLARSAAAGRALRC